MLFRSTRSSGYPPFIPILYICQSQSPNSSHHTPSATSPFGVHMFVLYICVSMVILTILIIPIHEHGISFHLFVSTSISFISILWFSKYSSFTSMVRFIPRYFTLFDAIVNGIVSLTSLTVHF